MPLDPETAANLAALAPGARQARRQHSPESPQGSASRRFTQALVEARDAGATVRELATATGISYHSVARRIRIADAAAPRVGDVPSPGPAVTAFESPTDTPLVGVVPPEAGMGALIEFPTPQAPSPADEDLESTGETDPEAPHPSAGQTEAPGHLPDPSEAPSW